MTEPSDAVAVLRRAEAGTDAPVDLLTVNALRWRMEQDGYASQRADHAVALDPEDLAVIDRFVRHGGGLLALHTAVICFDADPTWHTLCGASWRWDRSSHPPLGPVEVEVTAAGQVHEITRGVEPFAIEDEVYGFLDEIDGLDPLLVSAHGGRTHPLLWARPVGAGRVVTDLLGHGLASHEHPAHRTVLARAAAWAVGRPPTDDGRGRRTTPPRPRRAAHEPRRPSPGPSPSAATRRHATPSARSTCARPSTTTGDVVMADVLVNLHGDAHRARRRLENRLFRRDTHERYERSLFPPIVTETLAPHVAAGRAELVGLSHQLMMNLAASTAGVDRPERTAEETSRLYAYLMLFIEGATLAHYTGDRQAKRAEVAAALAAFDEEFLRPSISPAPGGAGRGRGRGPRRGPPAPRRADRAAPQPGRPRSGPRRRAARDVLLPPGRRAHVGHRVRPDPAFGVRDVPPDGR